MGKSKTSPNKASMSGQLTFVSLLINLRSISTGGTSTAGRSVNKLSETNSVVGKKKGGTSGERVAKGTLWLRLPMQRQGGVSPHSLASQPG